MAVRIGALFCLALLVAAPGNAVAQGYPGYPYTIMMPERGSAVAHRAPVVRGQAGMKPQAPAQQLRGRHAHLARGSSNPVLPTPLPRTPLIPPEGGGTAAIPNAATEHGPTFVPGINPVPNLPHGTETFQDRASRCAYQQGLYNVPGSLSNRYTAACLQ